MWFGGRVPLNPSSIHAALGPLHVFVGSAFAETIRPEHADMLRVSSYGTLGTTRQLAAAGALDIIPCHVSCLGPAIRRGEIRCDVAIVQLSPPGPNGKPSLGPINDYIRAAMEKAPIILAEVNDQLPWTFGPEPPGLERIVLTVRTSRDVVEAPTRAPSGVERSIASHAAGIIGDGATLQVGIGGTIDALLQCLRGRRELGIHSGTMSDGVLDLIESGVVTNARKPIDAGISVTASLFGGKRLFQFADRNPAVAVHPYEYTHSPATLARISNLVAINSAVEIDLTGQVNAEVGGERYIGAVGGQVDFMHAATRASGGCSIIALPSTFGRDRMSRIRVRVDTVTCARSEVDFVVTEHGHADLRGQALRERARRLIAIADPAAQDDLERQAHSLFSRGY
jgi:acyl-CoA hydrolase